MGALLVLKRVAVVRADMRRKVVEDRFAAGRLGRDTARQGSGDASQGKCLYGGAARVVHRFDQSGAQ
jgi:hypothetical protein